VESINGAEPVSVSISTNFWTAVAAGAGESLRGGRCACEQHVSSLSGDGDCCRGTGTSDTSGSESLNKGRGDGGDGGGPCFSTSKSERETFEGGGRETTFDHKS
jgi:hypothetical protein